MAVRAKTAADPAAQHFRAIEEQLSLASGEADTVPMGPPYRRSVVGVETTADSPLNHRTRWFAGVRSGFLSNASNGVVTVVRTAQDIAADGVDGVGINLVLGGRIQIQAGGRDEAFEAGELFLEDTGVPRTAVSALNPGGLLYIPRDRFTAAISTPIEQLNLMRLTHTPLAPVVSHQIRFLVENFGVIAPDEFECVLDAAIEISLALLRREIAQTQPPEDPVLRAARQYIAAHFREPDLTSATLARALGCSRAVLYRAFANAGVSVLRHLREVRFQHFIQAMRANPDATIAELAYDAGFRADPSDFTKLFKRTYGVTPSQAHARFAAAAAAEPGDETKTPLRG